MRHFVKSLNIVDFIVRPYRYFAVILLYLSFIRIKSRIRSKSTSSISVREITLRDIKGLLSI
jgi:hypothetical protein